MIFRWRGKTLDDSRPDEEDTSGGTRIAVKINNQEKTLSVKGKTGGKTSQEHGGRNKDLPEHPQGGNPEMSGGQRLHQARTANVNESSIREYAGLSKSC